MPGTLQGNLTIFASRGARTRQAAISGVGACPSGVGACLLWRWLRNGDEICHFRNHFVHFRVKLHHLVTENPISVTIS